MLEEKIQGKYKKNKAKKPLPTKMKSEKLDSTKATLEEKCKRDCATRLTSRWKSVD